MSLPLLELGDGAEVRLLEPADAREVFALVDVNRERLRPFMPWVDTTTSAEVTRVFIERARASETDLEALGIFVRGAFAGAMGLRIDPISREGEIGYWIDAASEGKGLVTRACRALIHHAFTALGLHRITLRAAPDNLRSRAIARRLGFSEEGVLREAERIGDRYHDLVVYGLLVHEWPPP